MKIQGIPKSLISDARVWRIRQSQLLWIIYSPRWKSCLCMFKFMRGPRLIRNKISVVFFILSRKTQFPRGSGLRWLDDTITHIKNFICVWSYYYTYIACSRVNKRTYMHFHFIFFFNIFSAPFHSKKVNSQRLPIIIASNQDYANHSFNLFCPVLQSII